ncbi:MAG: hypothetical protein LPJ92_09270 [Rhodobacterales bacterium]|nr:hypothetical protein [Rhodobacterales bacterium]MDX5390518.1 hypothetical protein [Rhodobacterales bacterium]MDX5490213.1 hypothetical protein [Rhodobacterales bacterium]
MDFKDIKPLTIIHHKAAQKRAHRVFAFSSTVWPEEWYHDALDDFIDDIIEFCFHAYRLCEIVGIEKGKVDISEGGTIHFVQTPTSPWETDFRSCLNAIRHADSFKVGKANPTTDRQLFKQNKNVMGAFIVVTTDRNQSPRSIPLFALSYSYLHHVRPMIASFLKSGRQQRQEDKP